MTDFNRGIYPIAWQAFRANFWMLVALAAVFALIEEAGGAVSHAALDFLLSALLNLSAHWVLLYGGLSARPATEMPVLRFVWASFLLALPAAAVAVVLMLAFGLDRDAVLPAFAGFLGALGVTLALCGTVLPSIAMGGRIDLAAALGRGRRVFWQTLAALAGGPAAFWTLLASVQGGLRAAGLPLSPYDTTARGLDAAGVAVALAIMLANVFACLLGAAALCRAYYRGGGA